MPRSPVPFHVQHIARPAHIEHILGIAPNDQPLEANSARLWLAQNGYSLTLDAARRSLDWASKLGLLEKETAFQKTARRVHYILTPLGQACRSLAMYRREVYYDIIHYLSFTAWELNGHRDYWSWSYARLCEIFYRDMPRIERQKAVFGQLSAEASEAFPNLDPVVGTETVGAVSNWLRELSPPFYALRDSELTATQNREWFSVELALLAVSYLYMIRGVSIQTPLLLDRAALEQLCPLCLTSTDRITVMIETAARTFSVLEMHTGEWGSSAILRQEIDILALV